MSDGKARVVEGRGATGSQMADCDIFPASSVQQRLWLLEALHPEGGLYNSPFAYRVRDVIDPRALRQGLDMMVERHEVLRTTFAASDGKVVQRVHRKGACAFRQADVSDEVTALGLATDEARLPFDLAAGPLIRAALFRLPDESSILVVTVHHTVFDGWSETILLAELEVCYAAALEQRHPDLPELDIQYADYAAWEQERLESEETQQNAAYWNSKLAELDPATLPLDYARPVRSSGRGAWELFRIPPALTSALKALAARENATVFMALAAGLQILLRRYSNQDDTAIGFVTAGRERAEVQPLIGCFINTLVLRLELADDLTGQDVVRLARRAALEAYDHQDLPFDRLIDGLPGRADGSRPSAFQVLINQGPPVRQTIAFAGLTLDRFPIDVGVSKFDVSVEIGEVDGGLEGYFEYSTDLFEPETIRRWVRHYVTILQAVADDPLRPLSAIPLLSAEDRAAVLQAGRGADVDGAREPIYRAFEAHAASQPDRVALVLEGSSLTYGDLDARANLVGHALVGSGVEPGEAVGVFLPRSFDAVAALLAIFKAGCVYVPMDPGYPRERLSFMVGDARIKIVITTQPLVPRLSGVEATAICVEEVADRPSGPPVIPQRVPTGASGAYILYTSGSTGAPKGVLVSHHALAAHTAAVVAEYQLSSSDTVLQFAGFTLDPSIEQIVPTLAVGGTLILRGDAVWGGAECFERFVAHGITVADLPTAYWAELVQVALDAASLLAGHRLRLVLVGGEAMLLPVLEVWRQSVLGSVRLLNVYGPTEATVTATCYEVMPQDESLRSQPVVSIGRPLAGRRLYILDRHQQLVPFGAPGEIHLGGEGLADGYLNRPDLTAERFPADPFVGGGARMYRTGDLGRCMPDGNVAFLGRTDDQVKIRGFRIEPAEVERILLSAVGAVAAAVVVKGDTGANRYLAAFVVFQDDRRVEADEIRRTLSTLLPDYMVPRTFAILDRLPLSPSGKIDRKALRALPTMEEPPSAASSAPERPLTDLEQRLALIWCDILELAAVQAHDDFFAMGGHSLLAIRLVTAVAEEFDVELPLEAIFEAPTLAAMAARVGREREGTVVGEATGPRDAPSETEQKLVALWQTLLEVDRIGVDDSFFTLQGGRRDNVARMFDGVRSLFGLLAEGLPTDEFMREPTVEHLARLIDATLKPQPSLVVPLHSSGTGTPLFLVHAGGGYVFFYRALAARLGRPVYGIRAATDEDPEPFSRASRLEEVAARYVREIRTVRPDGPYLIGGACFGGVVAFEMARQLREQGAEIEGPVLLLDAFVQNNPHATRDMSREAHSRSEYLQKRIRTHIERSRQLGLLGGVRYLSEKARANVGDLLLAVPAGISELSRRFSAASVKTDAAEPQSTNQSTAQRLEERQMRLIASFMEATDRLLLRYWPRPYNGAIALLGANESEDPRTMWAGLAPDELVLCCRVTGDHMSMFDDPAVADTATWMRRYLDGV